MTLPWSERVNMLSISPCAATLDDVARMAAELSAAMLAEELAAIPAEDAKQPETPTVKSIVADYLKAHGYGGLSGPNDSCGCYDDDLMPCDNGCDACEPVYKVRAHCNDCKEEECENRGFVGQVWCLTSEKPA